MPIRFAHFEITDSGELFRDGEPARLQPQPSKLLAFLASRAGELVTREELQQHVWGTETFIDFNQGLNWCIRRIREVLDDDAANPQFIQTVPRRGYRFIAALRAMPPARRFWTQPAVRSLPVALAALFLFAAYSPARTVTVLVLPFDNLGTARPAAEDVATEEVITALGAIDPRRLSVIDPLTAMKFKRTNECIIHIGRQLDAQYVLLGAVRQHGTAIRSTAQLFRVADNRQVWAAVRECSAAGDPAAGYSAMARDVASSVGVTR
ncbi:MAG TPA: winged helix-turn-helix domain-containing protein [Thermoanaerobaculia bacterium]|jgi:DNA-binding winged helix-turn-helix (wHTH) protein/TolB-like protein|nr:winged helix-turn-helix domain-containing protein [Thermoanaerobaculia bacterium]